MNLHENKKDFKELITIVALKKDLPESAIERDYFIVLSLANLENSEYVSQCVFKGGTSLSKCYPNSIERFSEDIDLTFLGMDKPNKYCDKHLKRIETIMTKGFQTQKIPSERNDRNKSTFVWFDDYDKKIKLEIGCSVKPDPYSPKTFKSYIHEYLEENFPDYVDKYELKAVTLNVLNIERTFVDKLMSVKRHAICKTLSKKVRHIYDVVRLFNMSEIKFFLEQKNELKRIIELTKGTDSHYLSKRDIPKEYNPLGDYDFDSFKKYFNDDIRTIYESMHKDLLYTNQKQDFDDAIATFEIINNILIDIGE